ncbi:MAG: S-methyl-5-thioribose kinase [Kiloniellales bacterium]|nr:S-methyl-5-thioribose kinase [Kiloniellales bacterium]
MPLETPAGYRALSDQTLAAYLSGLPEVAARLGGAAESWRVREVGDGNLNLVFIVEGPAGGVAVKQALPYVRLVGESWPLPLSRAHFEYLALTEEAKHAPGLLPAVYHYDQTLALIVMELLQPHIIMRRGMIEAQRYPGFAEAITTFMANTLFFTSDLALTADVKKQRIATFCGNSALCKITEDLIFTEPYMIAENNRWTSPQLDAEAKAIREDGPLKTAISELKVKFLSETQALLHGDLHTGSIMVTESDTRVIDPEFAFYGPMGFDVGAVIANLLLNYFSQDGHATPDEPREDYKAWVLNQVSLCWLSFERKFRALWDSQRRGDAYPAPLFDDDPEAGKAAQDRYMAALFADTLGFAAAKMIRRILGLAHNIDLEWIENPDRRAACERRALRLARWMMVERGAIGSIKEIVSEAPAV